MANAKIKGNCEVARSAARLSTLPIARSTPTSGQLLVRNKQTEKPTVDEIQQEHGQHVGDTQDELDHGHADVGDAPAEADDTRPGEERRGEVAPFALALGPSRRFFGVYA